MRTSVILIAFHGDRWLPACISSLSGASTDQLHLVLVDNTGNTLLDQLDLKEFNAEILQTPYPMGFAEANNYALAHASRLEETVLFLNQDTISQPVWVDRCLHCFTEAPDLGAVSPLIHTYDGLGWDPSFLACLPNEGVRHSLETPASSDNDWFITNNAPAPALIVRTTVLQRVGPFDPVFGSYYEDYDLCRRIRESGCCIAFCRSAHINHYSGSTTNSRARELKRMRQIIRNRVLIQLRESEKPRLPMVLRHVFVDFPRRLFRGLLRTPSSQPPTVTLQAYGDLLRIAGRLLSRRRDEAAWQAYLKELGWPHPISSVTATE